MSSAADGDLRSWTWRVAVLKSNLPPLVKFVLVALSTFMNDYGEGAYPSQALLAERMSVSERAVNKALGIARDHGWIVVVKHGYGGKSWARNEYVAQWPDRQLVGNCTELGSVPNGGEPGSSQARNHVPTNSSDNSSVALSSAGAVDNSEKLKKRGAQAQPLPIDWRPCAETLRLFEVRGVPIPPASVINSFVGHFAVRQLDPRTVPFEFLKWTSRDVNARPKTKTEATHRKASGKASDEALAAWEELRACNRSGRWPEHFSDERTLQALRSMGGSSVIEQMELRQVDERQRQFIALFDALPVARAQQGPGPHGTS